MLLDRGGADEGHGRYLMPGLGDMHVHVGVEEEFSLYLANGVTTVRDLHGSEQRLEWRESINSETLLDEAASVGVEVVGHVPGSVPLVEALDGRHRVLEHLLGYVDAVESLDSPFLGEWNYRRTHGGIAIDESRVPDIAALTAAADVWNCPTLVNVDKWVPAELALTILERPEMAYVHPQRRANWHPDNSFIVNDGFLTDWTAEAHALGRANLGLITRPTVARISPRVAAHVEHDDVRPEQGLALPLDGSHDVFDGGHDVGLARVEAGERNPPAVVAKLTDADGGTVRRRGTLQERRDRFVVQRPPLGLLHPRILFIDEQPRGVPVPVQWKPRFPDGPLPSLEQVVTFCLDVEQGDIVARDVAADLEGGGEVLVEAQASTSERIDDALESFLGSYRAPSPDRIAMLSPTLWSAASPEWTACDRVVPYGYEISEVAWNDIAGVVGLPLGAAV